MRIIIHALIVVFVSLLATTGCMTQSRSGDVYTRDQARTSQTVHYGTILRVAEVTIEGTSSGAGTLAGGAMGGALGSTIGGGSGRTIATVGGAIVGALAGSATEKGLTGTAGLEIEVQLDNGEVLVVVQENDGIYGVGERVRVLRDGRGTTRVRK